jgi:hypothetical protein
MPVLGRKFAGVPASVNAWLIGVPKVAPLMSKSVATTVPAPGATEVENAHGVGVSTPVRSTAGCATPLESVTTTEVEANCAPVGVAMDAPFWIATITGTRGVDMVKFLYRVDRSEKVMRTLRFIHDGKMSVIGYMLCARKTTVCSLAHIDNF